MTDRHDEAPEPAEYREDELRDKVSGLGDTPEDALEEVASRNDSLEERLPHDELSAGGHEPTEPSEPHEPSEHSDEDDPDVPHAEGAPGQG
jgi:hypothetical protein